MPWNVRDCLVTPFHYLKNFHYPCLAWTPSFPLSSPGPSPDVGEKGVDMPREHRDHVGNDEGCRRPSHQEEGDESHSPEEAQHRGERTLSSSDHEDGLLRAAWRRWPRHRQLTRGGTEAPRRPGQAQPRREGSAQRREGGGRTGSRVGGARAVLACCETGEVTKRLPGPAELERAATFPPTPRHATRDRSASFRFCLGQRRVGVAGDSGPRGAGQLLGKSRQVGWIPSSSRPWGFSL